MAEEKTHSWLSPSGLKPIVDGCVGKPFMEKDFPQRPAGDAALRGTRIHEIAERLLKGELIDDSLPEDELQIAMSYVDYVQYIVQKHEAIVHIEHHSTVFTDLDIGGTADCIIELPELRQIHLVDLKTGAIPVEADNNVQLLAYMYGFVETKEWGDLDSKDQLYFHIVQQGNPQDPWVISYKSFLNKLPQIEQACSTAHKLFNGGTVLDPSVHLKVNDGCVWCRAKGVCPAYRKHLREESLVLLDDIPVSVPTVAMLTPEQRTRIFMVKKQVESYLEEVEQAIRNDLEAGIDVPGLALVPGRTIREWNSSADVETALESLGIEPYRKSLITITDAEKQLGKRKKLLAEGLFAFKEQKKRIVPKEYNLLTLLDENI